MRQNGVLVAFLAGSLSFVSKKFPFSFPLLLFLTLEYIQHLGIYYVIHNILCINGKKGNLNIERSLDYWEWFRP